MGAGPVGAECLAFLFALAGRHVERQDFMAGKSHYSAACTVLQSCIVTLLSVRHWADEEPSAAAVDSVNRLHHKLGRDSYDLDVVLEPVLPSLTLVSGTVAVCGVYGVCWHDVIARLLIDTVMRLSVALIDATGVTEFGIDNWDRFREAVAQLDCDELEHAGAEARREALLAEAYGQSAASGNGNTIPANIRENGNCVTGGKGSGSTGGIGKTNGGKATVNARMLELIQKDLLKVRGWTAKQWAEELNCARSTVVETAAWKDLAMGRERARAERAKDRRQRRQGKSK